MKCHEGSPTQTAMAAVRSHAVLVIRLGLGGPGNPFELGPCRLEGPAATLACSAASRSLGVSLPSAFHMRMRVVASFTVFLIPRFHGLLISWLEERFSGRIFTGDPCSCVLLLRDTAGTWRGVIAEVTLTSHRTSER